MISIIVAKSKNNVIGYQGGMPWKQANDLQRFKSLTYGTKMLMGRKTFESIGKPLPNRTSCVVSSKKATDFDEKYQEYFKNSVALYRGHQFINLLESAGFVPDVAYRSTPENIFIIGGEQIYATALPFADRLYITELDCEVEGDAFFQEIDLNIWKPIATESYTKDEKNTYDYKFITYVRK